MTARDKVRNTTWHEGGFTLLEVLVALSVLSISVAVLFPIFFQSVDILGSQTSRAGIRAVAQSVLARTISQHDFPIGETRGNAGPQYRWTVNIQPYGTDDDQKAWIGDLRQIRVTVSRGNSIAEEPFIISTLHIQPRGIAR